MSQLKIFDTARIKLQETIDDTYNYIRQQYQNVNAIFSKASPFGQILSVLQIFISKIVFYIEHSITEMNIETASGTQSIAGIAKITGHNITLATAPTGVLSISLKQKPSDTSIKFVTIPNYININLAQNGGNYIALFNSDFLKIDLTTITPGKREYFRVFQGNLAYQVFTGTNEENQTYEVNLKEGDMTAMGMTNVYVNGERMLIRDSLYDMTFGEKSCVIKPGINSGISVQFGSSSMGFVPPLGAEIFVEYVLTDGPNGNVLKSNKLTWQFEAFGIDNNNNEINLNDLFHISMASPIDNGTLPEDINITKSLIPHASRSLVLAQTTNYEVMFRKMNLFSIIKVWTHYDRFNPYVDNIVYCVLVPDLTKRVVNNQGYFTLPIERFLLTNYEKYEISERIERSGQKIWGTYIYFVQPKISNYAMNLFIKVKPNIDKRQLRKQIIDSVSNYLLTFSRIDYLPKSEIIALLKENTMIDAVSVEFVSEKIEKLFEILFSGEIWKLRANAQRKYIDFVISDDDYEELYDYIILRDEPLLTQEERDFWASEDVYFPSDEEILNRTVMTTDLKQNVYNKFLSIPSIREYVNQYMDQFGNIKFQRNELPILRGGFNDRFGNYYANKIIENRLCPINIFFETIEKDSENNLSSVNIIK